MALAMPPSASTSAMWVQRAGGQVGGQALDVVAAAPGVDDPGQAALDLQEELGVAAIRAEKSVGRARASSSELVCRLWVWPPTAAMASTVVRGDVVEHVLGRQAPAGGLGVGAQRQGARVLRVELVLHQLGPEQAAGALLGDLHEVVHADVPEERQARREAVDRSCRRRRRRGRIRCRRPGCRPAPGRASPRLPACGSR